MVTTFSFRSLRDALFVFGGCLFVDVGGDDGSCEIDWMDEAA